MKPKTIIPFDIDLPPAHFLRLHARGAAPSTDLSVPVIPCRGNAARFVREQLGVQVRTFALPSGRGVVGTLLLRCDPELVVLLADLGDSGIHRWLAESSCRGLLRVGLRDESGICVVDVACEEAVEQMRAISTSASPCSGSDLVQAVGTIIEAIQDDAGRRHLDIGALVPSLATISVVTSASGRAVVTPVTQH